MRWSIFFILLAIVSSVYAIEPIISGEYFTGEYITVGNDTFILIGTDSDGTYWNNYSSVIFKNNLTLFKIEKGRCKKTEYYDYCFIDSYYNWDKNFTWQGSILEPSMIIEVYYNTPEVALDRHEYLELEYGRGEVIYLNFTNTGTKDTIIYYEEQLPMEFVVTNCNMCTITNNKVTSEVRLKDGETKTINYFVQYYGYNNFSWTANYNYSYDNKFKSEQKNIKSIVKSPYNVIESLTRSVSTTLGDISTFSVNVTNMQESGILNVNLSIHNEVVKNYNQLKKKGNIYTYEGTIPKGESKVFSIILDSYLVGEFPIYVDIEMETHNTVFKYIQNHSFNVSLNPLTPSLIVDKNVVDPNDTITLVASLKNTDEYAQYLYVYAHLLPQDEQWTFYKINPGKELILYNNTFPIPEDDDDLYIILSGVYRTINMQEQTFKLEKIIDVRGREPKPILQSNATQNNTTQEEPEMPPNQPTDQLVSDETAIYDGDISDDAKEEEKDFLTQIIESIDSFVKRIFGKK